MDILLSIVVPLYNAELYIEDCLLSLLDQGFDTNSYEIIIVNDGSTDKSLEIVEKYKEKYGNIRIVNQKNAGQSAARNTGIRVACGDYICFVDADDFLVRNQLANLVETVRLCNVEILTYGIIGGDYQTVIEKSKNVKTIIDDYPKKVQTGIEYISEYNYNNGPWYYLVKRDFLQKTKLFFEEGRKCEDGIFTMNLFLMANSMIHVNLPVYCYIIRENSTVTKRNIEHLKVMIDDFLYAALRITDIISQYKKKMTTRCYQRCVCRRDSYVFFLLIRMMEAKITKKESDILLESLKKNKLYPFAPLDFDYRSLKFKILSRVLNYSMLYQLMCFLYRIKK